MGVLFFIVFFFISFLIVALVLLQEGKGGGLAGMSAGMDGVMGAKNPLRKMTAWLFVFFILMAVTINWYFHQRDDKSLPEGLGSTANNVRVLEESAISPGPLVRPEPAAEGSLRPETAPEAASEPVRPEGATDSPAAGDAEATAETGAAGADAASVVPETTGELRPEPAGDSATPAPADVRPEAGAETGSETVSVQPPAATE